MTIANYFRNERGRGDESRRASIFLSPILTSVSFPTPA
jgi:hypothetical protein